MFKGICPSCHFSKFVPENMHRKRGRCGRCDFVFYMTRLQDSEPDFTIVPEPRSRPLQEKEPGMKDLGIINNGKETALNNPHGYGRVFRGC